MSSALSFRDATREQAKACILIEGLSGKGKSGLALLIAQALAGNWKDVFAIDTENKSLDLFTGITMSDGVTCEPFKKVDLLPNFGYKPSMYLQCKDAAVQAGGKVVVNDSITHMWQQTGGVLDLVSEAQSKNSRLNNYTAWGTDEVKREKQAIYSVVRDNRIHVISTVRVKEKFEMVPGASGRMELQSLGEQEMQMPDLKYEPDLVLHMIAPGNTRGVAPKAKVIKSRYVILQEGEVYEFNESLLKQLVEYLNEGVDPAILLEKQRVDYANTLKAILDADASKRTMLPILKQQQGIAEDVKLADMTLEQLQTLLGIMLA